MTWLFDQARTFVSRGALLSFLEHQALGEGGERYLEAETLMIFESSTQHTWLLATNRALYCIFDWLDEVRPRVKWRIPEGEIILNHDIILRIHTEKKSRRTGFVTIDNKSRRLYSLHLFDEVPIDVSIRVMIHKAYEVRS